MRSRAKVLVGGSHFDADALEAANKEPTLTVGSLLYRGRLLSAPEWLAWNERYAAVSDGLKAGTVTAFDLLDFYRAYFTDLFPRSRFRFWAPDPVPVLMAKPFGDITETFEHFFALQALANGVSIESLTRKTSGTDSGASTVEAAAAAEA